MTEQHAEASEPHEGDAQDPVRTGNAQVDTVLSRVEQLDGLPVSDHVAVFEHAHEQLREALDAQRPATQRPDA